MLKPILTAVALASGLAAGQAAAAPSVSCQGSAEGPNHSAVEVFLQVDGRGQVVSRTAAWTPPAVQAEVFPIVSIDYYEPGPVLAAPNRLGVAALADLQKAPPQSNNVEITATVDGRAFRVPWRYYAANIAEARRQLAHPGRQTLSALTGVIPVAFQKAGEEPLNPELLALLATGKMLDIRLAGDAAGESFGAKSFDLTDLKSRDALYAEATAKADEAAKTPSKCQRR